MKKLRVLLVAAIIMTTIILFTSIDVDSVMIDPGLGDVD